MIGCLVRWKCLVACLFLEESQHPTWPHSMHKRRCTQVSPIFRHSSQPLVCGVTLWMWLKCVQALMICPPRCKDFQLPSLKWHVACQSVDKKTPYLMHQPAQRMPEHASRSQSISFEIFETFSGPSTRMDTSKLPPGLNSPA